MNVLYIVATPIGNLEDITLRAIRLLAEAELVLAEDTRRTRVLLDRHGIDARPVSLHAHNEASRIDRVLSTLEAGGDVALVSDAGTPLISDPGERLVAAVARAGYAVSPVPGASAPASVFCKLPGTQDCTLSVCAGSGVSVNKATSSSFTDVSWSIMSGVTAVAGEQARRPMSTRNLTPL